MPKMRTSTISGATERVQPSRARPTKPPAKEISKRKRAALHSGGGRLPASLREQFERSGTRKRQSGPRTATRATRAGKREPRQGRYVTATEQHDRRQQRKSDTPETQPGAAAVPATRRTSNEPRAGKRGSAAPSAPRRASTGRG